MMAEKQSTNIPRSFEHYLFTWTIRHYCLSSWNKDFYLRSPLFQLGISSTSWELWIDSNGDRGFSVHLARSRKEGGPKKIQVNFKITVKNGDNLLLMSEKLATFSELCAKGVNCPNTDIHNILSDDTSQGNNELIVICEMFTFFSRSEPIEFPYIDSSSEKTEGSSTEICKSTSTGDEASDQQLSVLNSMLESESPYFREHSEQILEFIKSQKMPEKAVQKLLQYIHSGNFELLQEDSQYIFPFCYLVNILKIPCLQNLLAAVEISGLTEIATESYLWAWEIENFCMKENFADKCIKSKPLKTRQECWDLTLYPGGIQDNATHMGIEVRLSELHRQIFALIEISIQNKDSSKSKWAESSIKHRTYVIKEVHENSIFSFPYLLKRDFFEHSRSDIIINGALVLHFVVKLVPVIGPFVKSKLTQATQFSETFCIEERGLDGLSKNLLNLLECKHTSDMLVQAKEVKTSKQSQQVAMSFMPSPQAGPSKERQRGPVQKQNPKISRLEQSQQASTSKQTQPSATSGCTDLTQVMQKWLGHKSDTRLEKAKQSSLPSKIYKERVIETTMSFDDILETKLCTRVHKAILRARSPVFCSLIEQYEVMESSGDICTLPLPQLDFETMQELLIYIYSGRLNKGNWKYKSALKIYLAARAYRITGLETLSIEALKSSVNLTQVISVLKLSHKIENRNLKVTCLNFIRENSAELFAKESWREFKEKERELADEAELCAMIGVIVT